MSIISRLSRTVAAAALVSALATAAFVASPASAARVPLDGFQVSYGSVFDQWLVFGEGIESATHTQIGPLPAGFVNFSPWIVLTGVGPDDHLGGIPGWSDIFSAKNDGGFLTVGMISDGATDAAINSFVSTFGNGAGTVALPETGNWQDVSSNWGLPVGTFSIRSNVDVPEPASLVLLGSALLGFGVLRRRRTSV